MIEVVDTNAICACAPCKDAKIEIRMIPGIRGPLEQSLYICLACAISLHEKLGKQIADYQKRLESVTKK